MSTRYTREMMLVSMMLYILKIEKITGLQYDRIRKQVEVKKRTEWKYMSDEEIRAAVVNWQYDLTQRNPDIAPRAKRYLLSEILRGEYLL